MKKFKLQLEDLRIDSFATTPVEKARGTVFGEQCTCYTNCTCPGCPTCYASCNGTCDASCNGTCAATACGTCDASCNGTCGNTCDYSCGGTCFDNTCGGSCDGGGYSCDYTCSGYATAPDRLHFCIAC